MGCRGWGKKKKKNQIWIPTNPKYVALFHMFTLEMVYQPNNKYSQPHN